MLSLKPGPYVAFGDPRARLRDLTEIGQGSSGSVYVAHDTVLKQLVAVKKMVLAKGVNHIATLESEISIMKVCNHKNIVNYIESYILENQLWVSIVSFSLFLFFSFPLFLFSSFFVVKEV